MTHPMPASQSGSNMTRRILALLLLFRLAAVGATEPEARKLSGEVGRNEHRDMLALAISRPGHETIVARARNYPEHGADMRSATKSITALLVGIAIDRGQLP